MNNKNLITKIALGVAIAALVFSIVTLVRAIILNAGVFIAAIQVIGTAVIVAICAIMLYVLSNYEDDEETDAETDSASEQQPEAAADAPLSEAEEPQDDALVADLPVVDDGETDAGQAYDLSAFEE